MCLLSPFFRTLLLCQPLAGPGKDTSHCSDHLTIHCCMQNANSQQRWDLGSPSFIILRRNACRFSSGSQKLGGGWWWDSGRQQLARRHVFMSSLSNQSAFPYILFSPLLTPSWCPALFCPPGKRCFTNPPANTGLNFNRCFLPWPHTAQICCCCAVWRASVSQKWTNRADSLQTALIYVQLSPGANRQVNKAWQRWVDTLSVNCCPSLFKYIVCLCNIPLQGVKPCTGDKLLLSVRSTL